MVCYLRIDFSVGAARAASRDWRLSLAAVWHFLLAANEQSATVRGLIDAFPSQTPSDVAIL
jgi:hypothetical protein